MSLSTRTVTLDMRSTKFGRSHVDVPPVSARTDTGRSGSSYRAMAIVLLVCHLIWFPSLANAEIYSWVDEKGRRHYSNVLGAPGSRVEKWTGNSTAQQARDAVNMMRWHSGSGFTGGGQSRYDQFIHQAAFQHQVDPHLIKAIIKTESNFNQYALSPKGAQGLMQLMPMTARSLQVDNPFDARQNIIGGTRYIRQLLDCYNGNLKLSLAAYNAGPSLVSRLGQVPRIPETREYVHRVLSLYDRYRRGTGVGASITVRKLVTINP